MDIESVNFSVFHHFKLLLDQGNEIHGFHSSLAVLLSKVKLIKLLLERIFESDDVKYTPAAGRIFQSLESTLKKIYVFLRKLGEANSIIYEILASELVRRTCSSMKTELLLWLEDLPSAFVLFPETLSSQIRETKAPLQVEDFPTKRQDYEFLKPSDLLTKESMGIDSRDSLIRERSSLHKMWKKAKAENKNKGKDEDEELLLRAIQVLDRICIQKREQMFFCRHGPEDLKTKKFLEDFCCPLSLEIMFDPVIVSSGQTYERSFIVQWLKDGNTTCPMTRQQLSADIMIPNATVQAMISAWCKSNGFDLPEPRSQDCLHPATQGNERPHKNGLKPAPKSPDLLPKAGASGTRTPLLDRRQSWAGASRMNNLLCPLGNVPEASRTPTPPGGASFFPSSNASPTSSASLASSSSPLSPYLHSTNHVWTAGLPSAPAISAPVPLISLAPVFPRAVSCPVDKGFKDGTEDKVALLEDENLAPLDALLASLALGGSHQELSKAAEGIRVLTRRSQAGRARVGAAGGIPLLVDLLESPDAAVVEQAVTALLNVSIYQPNKGVMAQTGHSVARLVTVLQNGTPSARENAAATLFSLLLRDENRAVIGETQGAIQGLVKLLREGSERGKKDATAALFHLSTSSFSSSCPPSASPSTSPLSTSAPAPLETIPGRLDPSRTFRRLMVEVGIVPLLLAELQDPALSEKVAAVLANVLQSEPSALHQVAACEWSMTPLVDLVEDGSKRGKEAAVRVLLSMATGSKALSEEVAREGVTPALVALTQSGTPRAKEKAAALLKHLRERRQTGRVRHGAANNTRNTVLQK